MTKDQVDAAIKASRKRIRRAWYKRPSLMRFVAEHQPQAWEKIARCKVGYYTTEEDKLRKGTFRTYAKASCHQMPWCISCVADESGRRVRELRAALEAATPAGRPVRAAHFVFTALVRQDGGGWGMAASRDLDAFYGGLNRALQRAYGDGIGWWGSYQDFGERPFQKRNPHIDMTLNGWRVTDDGPQMVEEFDLTNGGRRRFEAILAEEWSRDFDDVYVSNLDLRRFKETWPEYAGAAKYQMREMVDVKKVTYEPGPKRVWWWDSKTERRTEYGVTDFLGGLMEYSWRLGQFGVQPRKELHRPMGHLAKRSRSATAKAMGAASRTHPATCACSECGEWQRVFLEDVVQDESDVMPLEWRT